MVDKWVFLQAHNTIIANRRNNMSAQAALQQVKQSMTRMLQCIADNRYHELQGW